MAQLETNLKLCLEAVKYAKQNIKRSANQTYFKPRSANRNKARNLFILGATRGGTYQKVPHPTLEDKVTFVKSSELKDRRRMLSDLIKNNAISTAEKNRRIDQWRKEWGEDYFWDSRNKFHLFSNLDVSAQMISKTFGIPYDDAEEALDTDDHDFLINLYHTKRKADKATRFGVGNCQEKGESAALYLIDRSPGGQRLALYSLDDNHKGYTGKIQNFFTKEESGGGDHVFGVYGHDQNTNNVMTLGPNAIIVDGWMNDAYPARHHLAWKHGYNYNNERISLKQMHIRNMVCVSYKSNIEVMRDFGVLSAGPQHIPVPLVTRKNL